MFEREAEFTVVVGAGSGVYIPAAAYFNAAGEGQDVLKGDLCVEAGTSHTNDRWNFPYSRQPRQLNQYQILRTRMMT
jgi:hypothetical protein